MHEHVCATAGLAGTDLGVNGCDASASGYALGAFAPDPGNGTFPHSFDVRRNRGHVVGQSVFRSRRAARGSRRSRPPPAAGS